MLGEAQDGRADRLVSVDVLVAVDVVGLGAGESAEGLELMLDLRLDGGRVLKAAVWRLTGRADTGTLAAGWGGRVTAVAVMLWPLLQERVTGAETNLLDMVLFFVIAMFLWTGASQAIHNLREGHSCLK